jgi:hypothetical protein
LRGTVECATFPLTGYPPTTVAETPVPLVAHELGQWAVYTDYDEIGKYGGVLKARNLECFQQQLDERGLGDQDKAFQQASGKFSWLGLQGGHRIGFAHARLWRCPASAIAGLSRPR